MTVTITGRLVDAMGVSVHERSWSASGPDGRLIASSERRYVSLPADEYADTQPAHIDLDWRHAEVIGQIVYLERAHGSIYIVGVAEDADWLAELDEDLYLSPSVTYRVEGRGGCVEQGIDATLDGIALTTSPASFGLPPVCVMAGDLGHAYRFARCRPGVWQHAAGLIERAERYTRTRTRGQPMRVTDPNTKPRPTARVTAARPATLAPAPSGLPAGIRYSGAGEILAIR